MNNKKEPVEEPDSSLSASDFPDRSFFNKKIGLGLKAAKKMYSSVKPENMKLDKETFQKALDFAYEKALNGIPGFDSASQMAENYLSKNENVNNAANTLITWQIAKTGTSGFLSGIGGIIARPVTIPANIASVLFVQLRMIAAIAYMGGYALDDDRVKSLVYLCLAGNGAIDIGKDVGILIGTKMTTQKIKGIVGKNMTAIKQKVGFRLLTKFGQTGALNLGKAVPLVGGLIGGTSDVVSTKAIGEITKKTFLTETITIPEEELQIK
ncbi:MAG: EcsC family protein [Spirochaetaceae bacterium]|nr:EcsC family protein [Spirochaetaceae bacterium]